MEALGRALEREPANGPFHYTLAALLALSGRWEDAHASLKRAEELGVKTQWLRVWLEEAGKSRPLRETGFHATEETTS
jgi:hypothetical protein